ncbi:triose-phosphate isomerase [Flexivirga sp. B27]
MADSRDTSKDSSSARTPLIAGNWKMNLDHQRATVVVQKLDWTLQDKKHDHDETEVAVIPPFTDLRSVQTLIDGDRLKLRLGAQDLSPYDSGAYTGDISGEFLAKLGCSYVVVGHSERRTIHNETDETVNAKVKAALRHELSPILCVGEELEVRKENGQVEHIVVQLRAALEGISADDVTSVVVAYEPIWAIGTGEVATPDDAQEACAALRDTVAELYSGDVADQVRFLYGGSVKSGNVASIMARDDVDGALVGGASLDPAEFAAICRFKAHQGAIS